MLLATTVWTTPADGCYASRHCIRGYSTGFAGTVLVRRIAPMTLLPTLPTTYADLGCTAGLWFWTVLVGSTVLRTSTVSLFAIIETTCRVAVTAVPLLANVVVPCQRIGSPGFFVHWLCPLQRPYSLDFGPDAYTGHHL